MLCGVLADGNDPKVTRYVGSTIIVTVLVEIAKKICIAGSRVLGYLAVAFVESAILTLVWLGAIIVCVWIHQAFFVMR